MECENCSRLSQEIARLQAEIERLNFLAKAHNARAGEGRVLRSERDQIILDMDRQGLTVSHIGRSLGMSRSGVQRVLKALRGTNPRKEVVWTEEMDVALRGLRRAGVSVTEIGRRFAISPRSVETRMGKLGLTMPRGGHFHRAKP